MENDIFFWLCRPDALAYGRRYARVDMCAPTPADHTSGHDRHILTPGTCNGLTLHALRRFQLFLAFGASKKNHRENPTSDTGMMQ